MSEGKPPMPTKDQKGMFSEHLDFGSDISSNDPSQIHLRFKRLVTAIQKINQRIENLSKQLE